MSALRTNDLEAYARLVRATKNDHLTHLLGQTDACLRTLASRLRRSLRKALKPECAAATDLATRGFALKGKGLALLHPNDLPSEKFTKRATSQCVRHK